MNPFEVKVLLLKKGITIAQMASDLETKKRKKSSLQVMISDLIYGRRFYPSLATELKRDYGIEIERPAPVESAREIVKNAA